MGHISRSRGTVCHDKQEAKGGLVLEALESLLDGGNRGPVVIAGDSKNSLLIQLLESTGKSRMPPKGALQPDKAGLEKVQQWINAGKTNSRNSDQTAFSEYYGKEAIIIPQGIVWFPSVQSQITGQRLKRIFVLKTGKCGGSNSMAHPTEGTHPTRRSTF